MATVRTTVRLFASAREAAGAGEVALDVPVDAQGHTTTAQVLAALTEAVPALAPLMASVMLAVNMEYVRDRDAPFVLRTRDEVALIPPVSGG